MNQMARTDPHFFPHRLVEVDDHVDSSSRSPQEYFQSPNHDASQLLNDDSTQACEFPSSERPICSDTSGNTEGVAWQPASAVKKSNQSAVKNNQSSLYIPLVSYV